MDDIGFSYRDSCALNDQELRPVLDALKPEIERIANDRNNAYESRYASVYLPFDRSLVQHIKKVVSIKKELKPALVIVIGIGGSNLGTLAADQGLRQHDSMPLYYADTIDPDMLTPMLLLVENTLKAGKQVLLNIVSKSGTTTETVINASLFVQLLKRYRPQDYSHYIVVTTEKDNELWRIAEAETFATIPVPRQVGGRFSVLSGVGLFPLALAGIDIDQLMSGAQRMTELCLQTGMENKAATSAAILVASYQKGFVIHDFFPFAVDMAGLGLWYRQLLAESIGKEKEEGGSLIHVGITPTISIGSTDLHSMVELHMAGPRNTFTTFVSVQKRYQELMIPADSIFSPLISHAKGKKVGTVLDAILQGAQRAYKQQKLPFMTVTFPEKNAFYYGQFFQWKMIEVMYVGYLLGINPFEQPLVELYKNEARAILNYE